MPTKIAAGFVGLASVFCFWLVFIFGIAAGSSYSVPRMIVDTFASVNVLSLLIVAWAVALLGGLLMGRQFKRLALALSIIAPVCGLAASGSELWPLHLGTAEVVFPQDIPIGIYAPRLIAASLMLAITLLGLSIQIFFSRAHPGA
jgi:hypothetical protein